MIEYRVDIFKGARSLGVELSLFHNESDNYSSCTYIKSISKDGLLVSDGRIKPGDRLLAMKQHWSNGETVTFNFENRDLIESKQILRKAKGQIELFLLRESNSKKGDSSYEAIDSDEVTLETPNLFQNTSQGNCPEKFDIHVHPFKAHEENGFGIRDSVKSWKIRKPRRKTSSKRFAVNFHESSQECCQEENDKVLPVDENNYIRSVENSECNVMGRFEVFTAKSELHKLSFTKHIKT